MSDSKSGSKSDLNESNMPLLDDEAASTEKKEAIEMTEEEKADEGTEKKDKKGKKEKKEKKPKEKKPKGPGCIETMSAGLNLEDRDQQAINTEIDLSFDDVLAEPKAAQGFDGVWRLSFVLFSQTKTWIYKILSALVAVPASLFWALVFAAVSVLYVWFLAPAIRLFEFAFYLFRRVWSGLLRSTLEPVCNAVGSVFSNVSVAQKRNYVQDA